MGSQGLADASTDFEVAYWVDGPGQSADRVDPEIALVSLTGSAPTTAAEKEEGIPQVSIRRRWPGSTI